MLKATVLQLFVLIVVSRQHMAMPHSTIFTQFSGKIFLGEGGYATFSKSM
jgi:hypothetical protein